MNRKCLDKSIHKHRLFISSENDIQHPLYIERDKYVKETKTGQRLPSCKFEIFGLETVKSSLRSEMKKNEEKKRNKSKSHSFFCSETPSLVVRLNGNRRVVHE